MPSHVSVRLTRRQLRLVLEALESHVVWRFSDDVYRDAGCDPADAIADAARREELRRAERLVAKLEAAAADATPEPDDEAARQQHH